MKTQVRKLTQIALMLFVFSMMLPQLKAQTIGSQIRIGADSTISYWNGTAWIAVVPGLPGQSLQFTNGVPSWIDGPQTPPHDIDGNIYDAVTIGTQTWMKQNLNVTHYRNGDPIPNITDNIAWNNLTTGAYCNMNNDVNNAPIYGRLYNFYAVDDSRKLCPIGWHVPNDADWTILTDYLGGESIAGGKLKEVGLTHWQSPNTGATNSTGFTGLPSGGRVDNGDFFILGNDGNFWSSTENLTSTAWYRDLNYNNANVYKTDAYNQDGLSVRCLKD